MTYDHIIFISQPTHINIVLSFCHDNQINLQHVLLIVILDSRLYRLDMMKRLQELKTSKNLHYVYWTIKYKDKPYNLVNVYYYLRQLIAQLATDSQSITSQSHIYFLCVRYFYTTCYLIFRYKYKFHNIHYLEEGLDTYRTYIMSAKLYNAVVNILFFKKLYTSLRFQKAYLSFPNLFPYYSKQLIQWNKVPTPPSINHDVTPKLLFCEQSFIYNPQDLKDIYNIIINIAKQYNIKIILFKPHPRSVQSFFSKLVIQHSHPTIKITILTETTKIPEYLIPQLNCKVCVSISSSTLLYINAFYNKLDDQDNTTIHTISLCKYLKDNTQNQVLKKQLEAQYDIIKKFPVTQYHKSVQT